MDGSPEKVVELLSCAVITCAHKRPASSFIVRTTKNEKINSPRNFPNMPSLIPSSPPTEPPLPPTPLHEQVEALSLVNAYLQKQITDAAHLDEKQAAAKNRLAARLAARKGGKAAGLVSSGGGDGGNVGRMAALAAESTRLIEGGEYRKALGVLVVAFKVIEKKYYVKEKKDGGAPDFGEDKVSGRGEGAGTGQGAGRRSLFLTLIFSPPSNPTKSLTSRSSMTTLICIQPGARQRTKRTKGSTSRDMRGI